MTKKTMTNAQYARHIKKSPQWVGSLDKQGRLVKNAQGQILVAESDALVNETADLSKTEVVKMHAKHRAEKSVDETSAGDMQTFGNIPAYTESKAKKEFFLVEKMADELKQSRGELLPVKSVIAELARTDSKIRNALESLPLKLAPMLAAEKDEKQIELMLTETIEQVLTNLSHDFKRMAA